MKNKKIEHTQEEYIKFCPTCNSTNVYADAGVGAGSMYICKNCGYSSKVFPEIESTKIKYLRPVPLEKVDYPNLKGPTTYYPIIYWLRIITGIVLAIFGAYIFYVSQEKSSITISIILVVGGIYFVVNAIKGKQHGIDEQKRN